VHKQLSILCQTPESQTCGSVLNFKFALERFGSHRLTLFASSSM